MAENDYICILKLIAKEPFNVKVQRSCVVAIITFSYNDTYTSLAIEDFPKKIDSGGIHLIGRRAYNNHSTDIQYNYW